MRWAEVPNSEPNGGKKVRVHSILRMYISDATDTLTTGHNNTDELRLYTSLVINNAAPDLTLIHRIGTRANLPIHTLLQPQFKSFYCSDCRLTRVRRLTTRLIRTKTSNVIANILAPRKRLSTRTVQPVCTTTHETTRGTNHPITYALRHTFSIDTSPFTTLRAIQDVNLYAVLADKRTTDTPRKTRLLNQLIRQTKSDIRVLMNTNIATRGVPTLTTRAKTRTFRLSNGRILRDHVAFHHRNIPVKLPNFSRFRM